MTKLDNTWVGATVGNTLQSDLGATGGNAFDSVSAVFPKYASVGGETVVQIDCGALETAFAATTVTSRVVSARRVMLESKLKQRQVFTLSATPVAELYLDYVGYGATSGTDTGSAYKVTVKSSGKVGLATKGNASAWLASAALTAGTKYRLETYAEVGTSATTGKIQVCIYDSPTATTPVFDSGLLTGQDLGGAVGSFSVQRRFKYDSSVQTNGLIYNIYTGLRSATLADAVNAADPLNAAPTATPAASAAQVISLVANATDPDGTIANYAWDVTAWPSGASKPTVTGATLATASFAWTVAGSYTVSLVVTDNLGATVSKTLAVTASAATSDNTELVWSGTAWV